MAERAVPHWRGVRLTYPVNAVVVVAGLPGAGKSTLIRRAVDRETVRVVDTDDQRRGRRRASYVRHYAHILAAVWGRQPVVIHSRGTLGTLRRSITLASSLRGRPAHLILLDVRAPPRRTASGAAAGASPAGAWTARSRAGAGCIERGVRAASAGPPSPCWTDLPPPTWTAYNGERHNPWGRQASTWSVRGGGCESRCRRPRKTPAKTQVRSLTTSRSLPSRN